MLAKCNSNAFGFVLTILSRLKLTFYLPYLLQGRHRVSFVSYQINGISMPVSEFLIKYNEGTLQTAMPFSSL